MNMSRRTELVFILSIWLVFQCAVFYTEAAKCPPGYIQSGTKCWRYYPGNYTLSEAKAQCRASGGQIPNLNGIDEHFDFASLNHMNTIANGEYKEMSDEFWVDAYLEIGSNPAYYTWNRHGSPKIESWEWLNYSKVPSVEASDNSCLVAGLWTRSGVKYTYKYPDHGLRNFACTEYYHYVCEKKDCDVMTQNCWTFDKAMSSYDLAMTICMRKNHRLPVLDTAAKRRKFRDYIGKIDRGILSKDEFYVGGKSVKGTFYWMEGDKPLWMVGKDVWLRSYPGPELGPERYCVTIAEDFIIRQAHLLTSICRRSLRVACLAAVLDDEDKVFTQCPYGYHYLEHSCVRYFPEMASADNARDTCKSFGGQLPTLDSDEKMTLISDLFGRQLPTHGKDIFVPLSKTFWVRAYSTQYYGYLKTDSGYTWEETGKAVDKTNWMLYEESPLVYPNSDSCAYVTMSDVPVVKNNSRKDLPLPGLGSFHCSKKLRFACEEFTCDPFQSFNCWHSLPDFKTFDSAMSACVAKGWRLPILNTEAKRMRFRIFLVFLQSKSADGLPEALPDDYFWVGARALKSKNFKWEIPPGPVEAVKPDAWRRMFFGPKMTYGTRCVAFAYSHLQKMNVFFDSSCNTQRNFICVAKGCPNDYFLCENRCYRLLPQDSAQGPKEKCPYRESLPATMRL